MKHKLISFLRSSADGELKNALVGKFSQNILNNRRGTINPLSLHKSMELIVLEIKEGKIQKKVGLVRSSLY